MYDPELDTASPLLSVISGSTGDVAMCPSYNPSLNTDFVYIECLIIIEVGSIHGACCLVASLPNFNARANLVRSLKCFSRNCMISRQVCTSVNPVMGGSLMKTSRVESLVAKGTESFAVNVEYFYGPAAWVGFSVGRPVR